MVIWIATGSILASRALQYMWYTLHNKPSGNWNIAWCIVTFHVIERILATILCNFEPSRRQVTEGLATLTTDRRFGSGSERTCVFLAKFYELVTYAFIYFIVCRISSYRIVFWNCGIIQSTRCCVVWHVLVDNRRYSGWFSNILCCLVVTTVLYFTRVYSFLRSFNTRD